MGYVEPAPSPRPPHRQSIESYIRKIEEQSGIAYHQLNVALSRLWVGERMNPDDPKEVSVSIPTGQSLAEQSTSGAKPVLKSETYPLPESVAEAQEVVDRWERVARSVRSDEDVADNVVQHMLHDRTSLLDEKWLGTEDEERNAYVSELLYIHSKLMIVDDRRVIVSAPSPSVPARRTPLTLARADGLRQPERPQPEGEALALFSRLKHCRRDPQ